MCTNNEWVDRIEPYNKNQVYYVCFVYPWVSLEYVWGVSWPLTPKDIPEPSHGRVFREKYRSVKSVWSLLTVTDLLFVRH